MLSPDGTPYPTVGAIVEHYVDGDQGHVVEVDHTDHTVWVEFDKDGLTACTYDEISVVASPAPGSAQTAQLMDDAAELRAMGVRLDNMAERECGVMADTLKSVARNVRFAARSFDAAARSC